MKEEQFRRWLQNAGYQDKVVQSRIANVRKIEETYPDLDSRIKDGTIANLMSAFTYNASDRKNNREPLHKIRIEGDKYNGTATYKSALSLYISFSHETEDSTSESKSSQDIEKESEEPSSAKDEIYKIKNFREWMCRIDGKSKGTAACYLSSLNYINERWKLTKNNNRILDAISGYLYEDNAASALKLIDAVDEVITHKMTADEVSMADSKRLNDVRSAIRKYRQFLEEEMEDIPDEDEFDEADLETSLDAGADMANAAASSTIVYPYSEIEKNFCFRLMTQNRMSNNKDIFYPIGIIRKLFRYSQRNARLVGLENDDYEWLKQWIKDYVSEIGVITSSGTYPLGQFPSLLVNPSDRSVAVVVNEATGSHCFVYTEQEDANGTALPMTAENLKGIHIDHTPNMATVLSEQKDNLPALDTLSKRIRDVAKKYRINIKPGNFGKISKKLFADPERVENELLPLIPAIKEELDLLKNKCELKLMQANYNLAKK